MKPAVDADSEIETLRFVINEETGAVRIDKAISDLDATLSRARVKALIEAGEVTLNGEVCTNASKKLKPGDEVEIDIPPPIAAHPKSEKIPLDVIYEDDDLLVINKQAGLIVHPGAGNPSGTLVNALLHHCGDTLSGINGVLRPGIVHRLDKDTTGLMIVAKNDAAHKGLAAQLEDRSLSRIYKALVFKSPIPHKGTINQPIGRHAVSRREMTVTKRNSREAITHYEVIEAFGPCALVSCKLESGRTHQIRVHMAWMKHPVIGDPVYGPQPNAVVSAFRKAEYDDKDIEKIQAFPRQALHAGFLSFIHPGTDEVMSFEAPLPSDLLKLLKIIRK